MNGSHPVADTAARRRALSPGTSFIVKAPAGSGKTELLTQRYLRLLATVDHPEEIVAITFTRKAASEMRSRVLEAIGKAMKPRPEHVNEAETWDLARAALARDEALQWHLLASPQRLRIGTIDSFCLALARQMPMLSRLGGPPGIALSPDLLYREAAREVIARFESGDAEAGPAIRCVIEHLDNDLQKAETLIAGMVERRDHWMRRLGTGESAPERAALEAALQRVIEDALIALRAAIPADEVPELVEWARFAAIHLREAGYDSDILACADLTRLPGTMVDDLPAWRGIGCLLVSPSSGDWRRTVNVKTGFPSTVSGDKTKGTEAKARFLALVGRLSAQTGLAEQLLHLRELPPPRYDEAQWAVVEALCRLLPQAVAELGLVFQRRGEVDFTEVAWSALRALGSRDGPTDLALTLDYRIRHLLVDEFQDTSTSQYELLECLTAGWSEGDGRTLFAVGDPMQSIYRFRHAEVGLFLRAWRDGIGGLRLESLSLEVNFRSRGGIVDWVNGAFTHVFPAIEDIGAGAVSYAAAIAHHAPEASPAVRVHPFIGRNDEAEAEQVIALVRAALADPSQERIAILVRSRGHLFAIAPRLRREGLRFRAVDIETLGHRAVVQDLLALTRALVHPGDRLSWLAVLRGPMCGLTLADLELLAGGDEHSVLWAGMQDEDRIARLSADGGARIQKLRAVLGEAVPLKGRRPWRRLIEQTWMALGGPACATDATDLADAAAYLDLVEQLEAGGDLTDIDMLADRVEELFALPDVEAAPRLQLMTIHKAKGLQFNTVIVPGLGRGRRADDAPLLAWAERTSPRRRDLDLLIAPIREAGAAEDPVASFLRRFEAEKDRHEDGRVLYVAATRAVDRLHLLGHVNVKEKDGIREMAAPAKDSLLSRLWPVLEPEFAQAFQAMADRPALRASAAGVEADGRGLHRRLPEDWRTPPLPAAVAWAEGVMVAEPVGQSPLIEFDWARELIRHVGLVVHECLQRIGREGIAHWHVDRVNESREWFARRLAENGLPPHRIDEAVALAGEAVASTLADDRGRWIFDAAHREARVEYAVSGVLEGGLVDAVIDRTFVDGEGRRWIIDYKTSSHRGGGLDAFIEREQQRYRPQLERYAALMRHIDTRPIRLGLYFPLLKAWREWEG